MYAITATKMLHVIMYFDENFPFVDGNGRIVRLIMFKECLRHGTMPFVIDDKRRSRYLWGIKEWHDDRYDMIDVVMEAQEQFEAQIELQPLRAASQFLCLLSTKRDLTMKMNEYMTALQTHLSTLQPNYPYNSEGFPKVLFDAYNKSSVFDNAAIIATLRNSLG